MLRPAWTENHMLNPVLITVKQQTITRYNTRNDFQLKYEYSRPLIFLLDTGNKPKTLPIVISNVKLSSLQLIMYKSADSVTTVVTVLCIIN